MKCSIWIVLFVTLFTLTWSIDSNLAEEGAETTEATETTTLVPDEGTTESSSGGETENTESPGDSTETPTNPADDHTETPTESPSETTTKSADDPTETPTESPSETTTESADETTTTIATTKKPLAVFSDNVDTATQNFIGIDCIINSIYDIEDATMNFEYEIDLCGSKVKREASDIFDEIENLKDHTKKVQNINDTTCKNKNSSQKNKTTKAPSVKCVKNIKNAMTKVNKSIDTTTKKVNAYRKKTSSSCAKISLTKFKLILGTFKAAISECAAIATDA